MVIVIAYYMAAFLLLLKCTYDPRLLQYRTAAKALTSAGFVLIAAGGLVKASAGDPWPIVLFPAFLLCMAGDVALAQSKKPKSFAWLTGGAACFLLGHVVFVGAFCMKAPLRLSDLWLPLGVSAASLLLSGTQWIVVKRMRLGVAAYAFFVTLLFTKGLSLVFAYGGLRSWLACLGGFLFLVSDCILYVDWFGVKKYRRSKLWNLVSYYLGMLLLALAARA